MSDKVIAFINKSTFDLVEVCDADRAGEITPNHGQDFYIVVVQRGRPAPTREEVESELVRLRKLHPDTVNKYTDDDGKECESIVYGKYGEFGVCCEPWEELNG